MTGSLALFDRVGGLESLPDLQEPIGAEESRDGFGCNIDCGMMKERKETTSKIFESLISVKAARRALRVGLEYFRFPSSFFDTSTIPR